MTGFQLIEVGTRQAEQVRNMPRFMERGTNTPEGSATESYGVASGKAVFFPSSQRVRQGGDCGETTPPLKGGCVFPQKPPPQPTQTAEARQKAEWVRENLPTCAKFATEFREAFGDVRLTYAAENGHVIGRKA